MKTKAAGILANAALLLASCLAGLLLCEAGLRLFHPKYAYLAEAPFLRDPNLLRVRIPDNRSFSSHRDTDARHPFFHNNLGLRQHRDFSAEDLDNSVNIGFFGDSFTENSGMKAQFSFTEPLDYLLNIEGGGGINVLNFGVAGYATAQSLLRYELLDFREALDHVFYVYYKNDLMENLASGLFRLDDAGRLARGEAPLARFTLLSKLHLPYLVLDAGGRLSAHLEEIEVKVRQLRREFKQRKANYGAQGLPSSAFPLFRQILRRWKEAAESNGASFHLVWLPMKNYDAPGVAAIVEEEGVETLNLRDCFGARDPAHLQMPWALSPYRFEHDGHWNEAGNRLAATCLHRVLESALGLPRLSEEDVALALRRYYSAFEASARGGGARGGTPRMKTARFPAIRRKYAALEGELSPLVPSLAELAVRARFDLHLHDGWLAYFKEDCTQADSEDRFFLHVFPSDARDLPADRLAHGFDNLDFRADIDEATCTIWRKLPGYAIDRIRTGQFSRDGDGCCNILWEAEHVLKVEPDGRPRKYAALEERAAPWVPSSAELVARSRFDLHLHDGWLVYAKEGCAWTDAEDRFFLHVFPADARDISPERREHGFDNLDFGAGINEATCTIWRKLPSYAIDRIRTGQFSKDDNGGFNILWQAEHVLKAEPMAGPTQAGPIQEGMPP